MRRFDRGCAGAFASCAMVALLLVHASAPPAAAQGRPRSGARSGELIPGGPRVGVDDRFVVGQGLDAPPSLLETMRDGSREYLYAAGPFVTADGVQVNGLARWDGERWEGVGDGSVFTIGGRRASSIEAVAFFDDGDGRKLYVGGQFDRVGEVEARGVACWDGVRWSQVGAGLSLGEATGTVVALVVFDDGVRGARLFAGGAFDRSGGTDLSHHTMLEDGQWTPVRAENPIDIPSDAANGGDHPIRDMAVFLQDGRPTLAMALAESPGDPIDPADFGVTFGYDGVRWERLWSAVTDPNAPGRPAFSDAPIVNTLEVDDDGSLYAAGSFATVEQLTQLSTGVTRSAVARWDGARWRAFVLSGGTSGIRVRVTDDESDRPGFAHVNVSGATLFMEIERPSNDFGQRWWSGRVTGLHIDDARAQLQPLTQQGRASTYEYAMFEGRVHAAIGHHPLTPDGAGNGVVRLDDDGWRTVTGSDESGLGANALASTLLREPTTTGERLLAAGHFSSVGGHGTSSIAAHDGHAWSAVDETRFLLTAGGVGLAKLHRIDAPAGRQTLMVGPLFDRFGSGNGVSAVNIVHEGAVTPVTFNGSPVWAAVGEVGAIGDARERLFSWHLPGGVNAVWDGERWESLGLEEFAGGHTSDHVFGVDDAGGAARLVLPDMYLVWNGAAWSRIVNPVFRWTLNGAADTARVSIDGRPTLLALGDAANPPPGSHRRVLARLVGDEWSPIDLSTAPFDPARMFRIDAVALRGREWAMINDIWFIPLELFRLNPGFPALFDGERVVSLAEVLGVEFDGRVYDILSNPLPDGREEVILAGDFLTLDGVPSARIGRVILPAVGDVNADGVVDGRDVAAVVRALGSDDAGADLDMDGDVDRDDLRIVIDAVRRSKGANRR